MHVTHNALAGRNSPCQPVLNGMARLVLRYRRIRRKAEARMTASRIGAGMHRIAIVGVDHMASGAARPTIIARLVIGASERQQRIEQTRALHSLEYRIGASQRAETAIAEAVIATLKYTKGIPRLREFELRQRPQHRQNASQTSIGLARRRTREQSLCDSVQVIAFTEGRVFERIAAVVV